MNYPQSGSVLAGPVRNQFAVNRQNVPHTQFTFWTQLDSNANMIQHANLTLVLSGWEKVFDQINQTTSMREVLLRHLELKILGNWIDGQGFFSCLRFRRWTCVCVCAWLSWSQADTSVVDHHDSLNRSIFTGKTCDCIWLHCNTRSSLTISWLSWLHVFAHTKKSHFRPDANFKPDTRLHDWQKEIFLSSHKCFFLGENRPGKALESAFKTAGDLPRSNCWFHTPIPSF